MEAIFALTNGNTGRTFTGNEDWLVTRAWSDTAGQTDLIEHPAAGRFREILRDVPTVPHLPTLVRGRLPDSGAYNWKSMGPPPRDKAASGRYNVAGKPALYLASSVDGVLLEVEGMANGPSGSSVIEFRSIRSGSRTLPVRI